MPSQIVKQCAKAIAAKKMNIAFAESATAGRMSSEFSLCAESGAILRGGISCYEVFVKEQLLKVPRKIIDTFTPESAEVTRLLAQHAAKIFNAKITVAVTGLTTPGGSEGPNKPVGTMYLHIITPRGELAHKEVFPGSPEEIILRVIDRAAMMIAEKISHAV
ncbi:MAG: CinA family protein [Bacteroidia bacterium]